MKFSYQDLKDSILYGDDCPEKDLAHVWSSEWVHINKMQRREIVFKRGINHYLVYDYREGNDFNGWEHVSYMMPVDSVGMIECPEVKRIAFTKYSWVSPESVSKKLDTTLSSMEECPFIKGEVFTNNKTGHKYTFSHMEIHSETLEPMVSYLDQSGRSWTRPYGLFCEKFSKEVQNG